MNLQAKKVHEYTICLRQHKGKSFFSLVLDVNSVPHRWDFTGGISINPADSRYMRYFGPCRNSSKEGVILHDDGSKEAVMIWDKGEYILEISSDANVELEVGVKVGYIKMDFKGKKVKGGFFLNVNQIGSDKWTMIKDRDRFAARGNFAFSSFSVETDRTLAAIIDTAEYSRSFLHHEKPEVVKVKSELNDYLIDNAAEERRLLFKTILEKLPLGFKPYSLDHVMYPEVDVLKKDVLGYYYMAAKAILPFVKDHPIHLTRYSNGIDKKPIFDTSFFSSKPKWVSSLPIYGEDNEKLKELILCQDAKTMLYLQNLSVLENSCWSASLQSAAKPQFYVISLRPNNISLKDYRSSLIKLKHILDSMDLVSYIKTSGIGWQMEVYIPFNYKYRFSEFEVFENYLRDALTKELDVRVAFNNVDMDPIEKFIEVSTKSNHKKGVRYPPYCLRASTTAQVSVPITWEQVKTIRPQNYTINSITEEFIKHNKAWDSIFQTNNFLSVKKVA